MSTTFSELLTAAIEKSNIGKNGMIKATGIDRSSFYQFLSGKRSPSVEQFQSIRSCLQIPRRESILLTEEYLKDRIGERRYRSRALVERCLRTMSCSRELAVSVGMTDELLRSRLQRPKAGAYSGREAIQLLLAHVLVYELGQEEGELYYFFPVKAGNFFGILRALVARKRKSSVRLCQLVKFPADGSQNGQETIEALDNILAVLSSGWPHYEAYYYYDSGHLDESLGVLFPYYIVSREAVYLFNETYDKGVVLWDRDIAGLWRESLKEVNAHAEALIKASAGPPDPHQEGRIYSYTRSLEDLPCSCFCCISATGLAQFARTGRTFHPDTGNGRCLSVEDRKRILLQVREKLGSQYFVIDETRLPYLSAWQVSVAANERLLLWEYARGRLIDISEPTIVQAFTDFMQLLPEFGGVLTREAAEEEIDRLLRECGQQTRDERS